MSSRLRQRVAVAVNLRGIRPLWMANFTVQPPSTTEEFARRVYDLMEQDPQRDGEYDRILDTDMVARGTREDGREVFVAVEASGVIDTDKIYRARQSAGTIARITGAETLPVAYGYTIAAEQVEEAKADSERNIPEVHIFLEAQRF